MTVQLELWQLITLLLGFFSCIGLFGRILLAQAEKRLDERFKAQEKVRDENKQHWDEKFGRIENAVSDSVRLSSEVERQVLRLKADLPRDFVMRDDYVRNQTVIEAKLDAVALRLENAQLKGANL